MGRTYLLRMRWFLGRVMIGLMMSVGVADAAPRDPAVPLVQDWIDRKGHVDRHRLVAVARDRLEVGLYRVPSVGRPSAQQLDMMAESIVDQVWSGGSVAPGVVKSILSGELGNEMIAKWLMVPALSGQGDASASQSGRIRTIGGGRLLRVDSDASRLVSETGIGGIANGWGDPGELVRLQIGLKKATSQPLFSTSVWASAMDSCLLVISTDEQELSEYRDEEKVFGVSVDAYLSRDCRSQREVGLQLQVKDTWEGTDNLRLMWKTGRSPEVTQVNARIEADNPGSSRGDYTKTLSPNVRFELRTDASVASADEATLFYRWPNGARGLLFDKDAYAIRPMMPRGGGSFRAVDDVDFIVKDTHPYDEWIRSMQRPWLEGDKPVIIVAVDVMAKKVNNAKGDVSDPSCAERLSWLGKTDPKFVPTAELVSLMKQKARLEALYRNPGKPAGVTAVDGTEVVLDPSFCHAYLNLAGVPNAPPSKEGDTITMARGYFTLDVTPASPITPTGACCDTYSWKLYTAEEAQCSGPDHLYFGDYSELRSVRNQCRAPAPPPPPPPPPEEPNTYAASAGIGFSGLAQSTPADGFNGVPYTLQVMRFSGSISDQLEITADVAWRTSDIIYSVVHALSGARYNLVYNPSLEFGPYQMVGLNATSFLGQNFTTIEARSGVSVDIFPIPMLGLWADLGVKYPGGTLKQKALWFGLGGSVGF